MPKKTAKQLEEENTTGQTTKKAISEFKPNRTERALWNTRKKRFAVMMVKKELLGIDRKCDRMDALFTPHLTSLDDPSSVEIETSDEFANDIILQEKARKSMPVAFEKITTAIALLIQNNPKAVMKPSIEKFRKTKLLQEKVYEENFTIQKKKRILRKAVYHLSKYGICYWREYVKKTFKIEHKDIFNKDGSPRLDKNGVQKTEAIWVYDIFDVVGENVHPKNVVLDDSCLGPKDVNKPANDLYILEFLSQKEFDTTYPEEKYPNAKFVKEGQFWSVDIKHDFKENEIAEAKEKIQVLTYESKKDGIREIWSNKVPIESVPLPGGDLSVNGTKWVEDLENYDGIGVGQICELYLPILDDITNASAERLRQIVRPAENWFNNLQQSDESDDIDFEAGARRKFTGNKEDLEYSRPPVRTNSEANEKEEMMDELDRSSMVPRNLAGTDAAKTAYQSAQNREAALSKLTIPTDNIKELIEDAANLDLKLYGIAYSEPLESKILKRGDDDFDEALEIAKNENDERAVIMKRNEDGEPTAIARRKFREMELPLAMELEENAKGNKPTGRIIETDEMEFWELIPKMFNWQGRIEIIAESFLPVSKAIEDAEAKETIDFLLNVPVIDEMGNPTITDAEGVPHTINKVRLIKDRVKLNKNFDPDKYVLPINEKNIGQGNMDIKENPLNTPKKLTSSERTGNTRPELRGQNLL